MSIHFGELQKIAAEEFGVKLKKSEKKLTFEDLFGFDPNLLPDDGSITSSVTETVSESVILPIFNVTNA